jgi:hypothetical protein
MNKTHPRLPWMCSAVSGHQGAGCQLVVGSSGGAAGTSSRSERGAAAVLVVARGERAAGTRDSSAREGRLVLVAARGGRLVLASSSKRALGGGSHSTPGNRHARSTLLDG